MRCVHLATSIEDAQINAVTRLIARHGRLLDAEALRGAARGDAGAFGPGVQFRLQRELEPPTPAEGFSHVETVAFERRWPPGHVNRALFVWCDGILMRSRSGARTPVSADDVDVVEGRGAVLRRHRDEGWLIVGMSWQPEIADGARTPEEAEAVLARMRARLDVDMDTMYCPHAAGPPVCWCRKPLPGLAVLAIETTPARSGSLPLRRRRTAGSRLRASPRVHLPHGVGVLPGWGLIRAQAPPRQRSQGKAAVGVLT